MTQVETERLLRPRATSQAAPIPVVVSDPAATAPLLPGASPASAPATTPRRRLLKCLLLGGALYASLLLFWSTSRMGLLNAANGSGAPSTFRSAVTAVVREAKELQLMRMEFLLTTTGSVDEPEARISTLVPPVREEKPTEQASTTNPKEAIARAEEHARSVKMLPDEKKKRRLKCVGWRATGSCTPHGPREPENDKGCYIVVPNSRYCSSLRYDATFRCNEAPGFVNYQVESVEAADKALAPGFALPNVVEATSKPRDGIVMVVYPKLIASAYATIRALRTVLQCQLPIEVWYRQQEIRAGSEALAPLLELANTSEAGEISFHKINDLWATGFGAKLTGEVKRKTMYHRTQAVKNLREKLLKEGINGAPDQQAIDDEVARLSLTPAPTLEPLEPDGLPDPAMWTHLLSFNTTSRRGFYKIQPYRATPQFPDWQRCYGQRELDKNQHFYAQEFADLPFSGLETHIRKFAQEAEQTRQRRVELSAR
ncbi:hypothetical protein KRP22_006561 [Phytophthora ramorum]|nr:hypothetical protein KRP22_2310 [Phytophthora ramorum]